MHQELRVGIILASGCLTTLVTPIRNFEDLLALIIAGIIVNFLIKLMPF